MIRVLGIDPGATAGLAILEVDGRTTRLIHGDSTRDIMERHIAWMMSKDQGPTLVAVESAEHIYPRARFGVRMANGLARAQEQVGWILGAAEAHGIRCEKVSAAEWRKALCGRANASDAMVKQVVQARVEGLPARTSVHVRDAIGVALFAALRLEVQAKGKRKAVG